jgi:zinc protease
MLAAFAGLTVSLPGARAAGRADLSAPAAAALSQNTAGVALRLDDRLPTDPALVTGELANGVRYIIRQHANPPGRVAAWMHVGSGGLNEEAAELGVAHYLEHMAFNGSANFPPGSVVKFFEELGLTFGRHQNAFTSIDQTAYQLALGDNKPQSLDKALLFFSDVAFRLTLDPKEIEEERQVIIEEKRSRQSPQQRMGDQVIKRLMPGSLFETHIPLIGTEQTIMGVQRPAFENYWKTWYTPTNIAVIVVGDMDPQVVRETIQKHFASEPRRETPPDRDPGVVPFTQDGAIVVTDPEQQRAEISFAKVDRARPPTTTVSQMRSDLVELIGTWCLNQRLAKKLDQGSVSFINADVSISTFARSVRWTGGQVTSEPAKWAQAFKDLTTEVQRARLHGFTQDEVDSAVKALISNAEGSAQREGTVPAQALLASYNAQVADGEPIMSPTQTLELMRRLLPTVRAAEVSTVFKGEFDPTNIKFIAELPSSGSVPTEAELVKFGRDAFNVTPPAEAATAKITQLMAKAPAPSTPVDVTAHEATGVTSAWLASGARVHYRFMDVQKNTVTVTVTLAAGALEETPDNRGVSEAAALAFARPATGSLSSTEVREFMSDKKVGVRGNAGDDTFTLTISGTPDELETGLQLAHLLLTDPVVEPAALDQWKTATKQAIAQRKSVPQGVMSEIIASSVFPAGDARTQPLEAQQVDRLTAKQAQEWITRVVRTAPVEISVVGDIPQDRAMELVSTYLGSLAQRQRIGAETLDDKRALARAPGPRNVERAIKTQTKQAIVLSGFFGSDAQNVRDTRLLNVASRVLSVRMNKVIREEKQLVYSIGAGARPATVWPGFGLFFASAPTDTPKVPELVGTLGSMYEKFAAEGITDAEMQVAVKQIYNTFDEQMKDPGYWTSQLSALTYRDRSLDDIAQTRAAYADFTPADVLAAFKKYFTPEARMVFVVTPEGT